MRVLVTGSDGFIGKNLCVHLRQRGDLEVLCIEKDDTDAQLAASIDRADFIFHLAGVNRPVDPAEFAIGNRDLTNKIAELVINSGRAIPILLTSSLQAQLENPYAISKRGAEDALLSRVDQLSGGVHIFRLPNVFGKWCRPNYNSAVATFCNNISRGIPISIHDPASPLTLVYIDDVVGSFISILDTYKSKTSFVDGPYREVSMVYQTTVGEVATHIQHFHDSRRQLSVDAVGNGLLRALYSTYLSYLQPAEFSYPLTKHVDPRGEFAEVLKTANYGQFSYFTAHPGITRGGHYHHTKNEKFLVVRGRARFGFRHILTNETFQLETSGSEPQVVDTIPGWAHDITNIGDSELIVMLWANEVFDRSKPDTISHNV